MNHHHRDLRRNPRTTDWEKHIGRSPTDPEVIERLVRKARRELGVIVFRPEDLQRMAPFERVVVEGVHRRICERSGN